MVEVLRLSCSKRDVAGALHIEGDDGNTFGKVHTWGVEASFVTDSNTVGWAAKLAATESLERAIQLTTGALVGVGTRDGGSIASDGGHRWACASEVGA